MITIVTGVVAGQIIRGRRIAQVATATAIPLSSGRGSPTEGQKSPFMQAAFAFPKHELQFCPHDSHDMSDDDRALGNG